MDVPNPSRVILSEDQVMSLERRDLFSQWLKQDEYVDFLERKHSGELKLMQHRLDVAMRNMSRRESTMKCKLSLKDRQIHDYMCQLRGVSASCSTSSRLLMDPAVNITVQKLQQQLSSTRQSLEQTQSELSAWKFTPDSQTGKLLMAKCRLLYRENEDLGRMICSGKLAKLESELALQKNLTEELESSQSEIDELVQEMDDDLEAMQSTILFLQRQLRESRVQLPAAAAATDRSSSDAQPGHAPDASNGDTEREQSSADHNGTADCANGDQRTDCSSPDLQPPLKRPLLTPQSESGVIL